MGKRRIQQHYSRRSARLLRSADAAAGRNAAGLYQPIQLRGGAAGTGSIGGLLAAALARQLCDRSELVEPVDEPMVARDGTALRRLSGAARRPSWARGSRGAADPMGLAGIPPH